jgi:peptidoglycan/LPS O-acetylase OafA/YrhL
MNGTGSLSAIPQRGQRFLMLDLMRGIAAISVLVYHTGNLLNFQMPSAYLAVDLFFLLSGFVIAHNYDRKIAAGMSFTEFVVQRLIRLYPCLLLTLLLGVLIFCLRTIRHTGHLDGWGVLGAACLNALFLPAMVQPFRIGGLFPFDGASWSLTFELIANVAYWYTFRRMTGLRLALLILLALVGVVLAIRVFGQIDLGMRAEDFWWGIPRVTLSFFMGVALRRYFYERVPFKLEGSAAPLVLFWLLLLFSLNRFVSPGHIAAVELLTIAVLFPLLLLTVAGATPGPRMALICKWTGDASYPVYLLQVPFMGVVAGIHQWVWGINAPDPVPAFGIVHVLGTIACALCIDRYYELPVRKFLKARWQRLQASPVSSTRAESVDVH